MARGMRQQLIQNREDNRKRAAVERKKLQEFQSIMKAHLPPIAEQSFQVLHFVKYFILYVTK